MSQRRTSRRDFLKIHLIAAPALGISLPTLFRSENEQAPLTDSQGEDTDAGYAASDDAFIIDTNVDLCCWPFRRLKYANTSDLVAKLRKHRIRQAWCGSYAAKFHRNIDAVNTNLAEECRANGEGILVPFGTVNPAYPDWEEDLRRCDEEHDMPGIKLLPTYHGYEFDDPDFIELLKQATERGMYIQIAIEMEDERLHHPRTQVPDPDVTLLPLVLNEVPDARVMLVNAFRHVRGQDLVRMIEQTDVMFEYSNLDGLASVERMLNGEHWYLQGTMPLERLAFGSHFPFFPLENALFKLVTSPLTRPQIDALAFANAENLLQTA